jgi:hypothetical protein
MTDSSHEDAIALADPHHELHQLRDRIGKQSFLLKSHAQELAELRAALVRLDEQIDADPGQDDQPNEAVSPTTADHS